MHFGLAVILIALLKLEVCRLHDRIYDLKPNNFDDYKVGISLFIVITDYFGMGKALFWAIYYQMRQDIKKTKIQKEMKILYLFCQLFTNSGIRSK